ncbi:hypothetical protein BC829DRAFT_45054 [Chytridium lagenaria]|nr:hypothetical protein BC829DRAFT_45054 [Chytridium lagenaria]
MNASLSIVVFLISSFFFHLCNFWNEFFFVFRCIFFSLRNVGKRDYCSFNSFPPSHFMSLYKNLGSFFLLSSFPPPPFFFVLLYLPASCLCFFCLFFLGQRPLSHFSFWFGFPATSHFLSFGYRHLLCL